MKKLCLLLIIFVFLNSSSALADIIYLKSGRYIEGEIVGQNNEFVKINCMGMGMYVKYKQSSIAKIVLEPKKPKSAEAEQPVLKPVSNKTAVNSFTESKTIEKQGYIVYLPSGLITGKTYPLIIVFDPGAHAQGVINFWKPIAEKKKLIIYASKHFRNGLEDWFEPEEQMIESVIREYPVNRKRIISTGVSGGGMGAHMLAFYRPDLIKAVITNVGRINPFFKTDSKAKQEYPHNKIVVFLAGTEDFNYKLMRDDQHFLSNLYWQTKWLEFKGGHGMAPPELYNQAVYWIENH